MKELRGREYTPEDRIRLLFDPDGLSLKRHAGIITGTGKIEGIAAFSYADDFMLHGGALGKESAGEIVRTLDMAYKAKAPFIALIDSAGASIAEGISSLDGFGMIFSRIIKYSGSIPMIAVVLGNSAGGASYAPALMDAVFISKPLGRMFLTGAGVANKVLFQNYNADDFGAWEMHSRKSGVVHFAFPGEKETLLSVRKLIAYGKEKEGCPSGERVKPSSIVPESSRKTYDMRALVSALVDEGSTLEYMPWYAGNALALFARVSGHPVGIVANNPRHLAGAIDTDASYKISSFVNLTSTLSLPLVTLVDVPAFLPGKEEEEKGIIRHGSEILTSYVRSNSRKLTIAIRKAYGGAYIAMGSKSLGAERYAAWKGAEIAVLGKDAALEVLYKKKLPLMSEEEKKRVEREYEREFHDLERMRNLGLVDSIINPDETRDEILSFLES